MSNEYEEVCEKLRVIAERTFHELVGDGAPQMVTDVVMIVEGRSADGEKTATTLHSMGSSPWLLAGLLQLGMTEAGMLIAQTMKGHD